MKDFRGEEVSIGDIVIFMELKYRSLTRGEVVGITPKKFRLKTIHPNIPGHEIEVLQFQSQVILDK